MPTEKMNEKRHFQRIFYNANAQLSGEDSETPCKILDISLKGCLLEFETPWSESVDKIYTLKLQLSDDLTISMPLKVVHNTGTQIGCKCEQIDIDSMTNLRRLVELNLGDIDMLNRELNALISA